MEIKKRDSSHRELIWFYDWKVGHGSDLSTTTCDGVVLDRPIRHTLNFC